MNMICHEDPGMDGDPALPGLFIKPIGISSMILVRAKAHLPIIPALNEMHWYAWQADSW
jgi:hypothetical protein